MTFEDRVAQFIDEHRLIRPKMRIVVGVSGGSDSMALLHYLNSRREKDALVLIACSVDHGLRGEASYQDLQFVASFCRQKDILFYGEHVNVPEYLASHHLSSESAGRKLRYRVFEKAMAAYQADALALAHHGDDQIETMLMRQVRGSFGISRQGIPVKRDFAGGQIIRPFLTQTKAEIAAYCRDQGVASRLDETNDSEKFTRNRFRKHILPFLKKENPKVHLRFQYESERIAEDEQLLLQLAREGVNKAVLKKEKDEAVLSLPALFEMPPSLQRRAIHLILSYLYDNRDIPPLHQSIHIETLINLLRSRRPSGVEYFPKGLVARKSYDRCAIGFRPALPPKDYNIRLIIPGRTRFSAGMITAEFMRDGVGCDEGPGCFIFDFSRVKSPLRVRTRRSGDRMKPKGMDGSQKIKDIFINEKIDREKRFIWPLVVDGDDTILWVPLLRYGQIYGGMDAGGPNYLKLTFIPTDNLGRKQNEGRFTGDTLYGGSASRESP